MRERNAVLEPLMKFDGGWDCLWAILQWEGLKMSIERTTDRFIRLPELQNKIGIGRSSIYNKLNSKSKHFDPTFPVSKQLGANTVAWLESEVDAWMQAKCGAAALV